MVSISLLGKLKAFEGLTDSELEQIAELCREEDYEAGAIIYEEGEIAHDLYVVAQGKVSLEMGVPLWPHAAPTQVAVDVVIRGEVFGKSALEEPHIRTLSPRCEEKTSVIAIEGSELRHLLDAAPHIGYELMERIADTTASRLMNTRRELLSFLGGEKLAQEYTPEEAALIQRVHYFIQYRWVAVIGIALLALVANQVFRIGFPLIPVLLITGIIALYNLWFWLRARNLASEDLTTIVPRARSLAQIQAVADLVAITLILHYTGSVENPFAIYFVFHIIITSVLLPQGAAYLLATFAAFLFCSLVGLEYLELIPHIHLQNFLPLGFCRQESYIVAVLLSLVTVLYISAYMTSSIAGELRKRQREVASLKDRCLIDVSALGEANDKLVELDRLRSHFVAIASHDLKAPLAAVQTYLQVILGGFTGEISDEQRAMLKRSSIRIEGLLRLINDILDATRIQAGQIVQDMEEMCLAEVVEDALENVCSVAEEKGLELSAEIAEGLPEIVGAPRRLAQVITNLSNNAVQFTSAGGKVTVRVGEDEDRVRVEVMDTGIGIPPEDLPRIFEEFYRGKDVDTKGAGLGLAIAKKIVEAHGGEIWAESPYLESEKGSKFTFTLPKG
jgi:signal transduction histidine kinase